ncbi:MAG: carboxypeptidase regulatory-like domain-containing protein [Candidatus Eremiobacteraeota bacterium]|nr:carboxypeptidase regulatory-like domain-containing protein [Candidatus Eremiobacteraeota bacterium]
MNPTRIAAVAAVLSLGAVSAASAQGPASMRGVVYECSTRAPLANALVTLRNTAGNPAINLRADADGRFRRVGLEPGTYQVTATGKVGRHTVVARRLAKLESDDTLEVAMGTTQYWQQNGCEPYYVPLAVSTADRYILH